MDEIPITMNGFWNRETELRFSMKRKNIIEIGSDFYRRGWLNATSGNLSAVVTRNPLIIAISESGSSKGKLKPENIIAIDGEMNILRGNGKPSSETLLHLFLIKQRLAGSVLHTHSVWSNVISSVLSGSNEVCLKGYEMLKALDGVKTHDHEEHIPIIDNDQDMSSLSSKLPGLIDGNSSVHSFILREHGLYTWGKDPEEAFRHTEALEYLLETEVRKMGSKNIY